MHGIQAWVALPTGAEESDPSFHHHEGADLPEWHEQGIKGRLIAGKADGLSSSVKVHSPLFYQHLEMQPGARRSVTKIGRASCRERVCRTCRSRWSQYHSKKNKDNQKR